MTPFRNDETNPFARQSPWPGMPQTVLRPTTTPAAVATTPVPAEGAPPLAQPEPEPPPQPVTLIRTPIPQLEDSPTQAGPVAAAPMFMASPAARPIAPPEPVAEAKAAAPISPPPAAQPVSPQPAFSPVDPAERLPKFRPLDEEETRIVRRSPQARSFNPELYDADIFASHDDSPLVSPIGPQRARGQRQRERPAGRELRLTPLLAAAAVGAGGTAALFLMVGLGRESALTAPKDPASSLAAGQLVGQASPPALRAAIPSEPPAALTAMTTPAAEPAKVVAPRLAMARVVRAPTSASRIPAAAAAAEPAAHIDIPAPPAAVEPAPTPAAAPVLAAPPPAVPFVRPPAPDAQAPISRHVPDPS